MFTVAGRKEAAGAESDLCCEESVTAAAAAETKTYDSFLRATPTGTSQTSVFLVIYTLPVTSLDSACELSVFSFSLVTVDIAVSQLITQSLIHSIIALFSNLLFIYF